MQGGTALTDILLIENGQGLAGQTHLKIESATIKRTAEIFSLLPRG
jgi:hypothetical protein